jgi:hypothetical protein
VYPWPDVAIHLHLLPRGKLLSFSDDDHVGSRDADFSKAFVIAIPAGGAPPSTYVDVHNTTTNMFCSGHAFLPDGSLLVMGGHEGRDGDGSADTNILDGTANGKSYVWRLQARHPMNAGRWYPSALAMGDGSILTFGGSISHDGTDNELPEVWQWPRGGWRKLTSALRVLDKYARVHLAPDGRAFICSPGQTSLYLDVNANAGTGAWAPGPVQSGPFRDYSCSVMYQPGKVLVVGGADPPTNTALVIDLTASSPTWTTTGSMTYPRRQHNATILPDGKVLVTGGTSSPGFNDATNAVLAAEVWDPATGIWTVLPSATVPRAYHSTALLLPDGRVISAGGGRPAPINGVDNRNAEIFWPPYLAGTRPRVTDVSPTSAPYGQTVVVTTPDAGTVSRVTMVGISSVTHGDNMSQRFNELVWNATTGGLFVNMPTNRNLAPPGHYMLFLLSRDGTPSLARMIRLG